MLIERTIVIAIAAFLLLKSNNCISTNCNSSYVALGDSLAVGIAAIGRGGYTSNYYKWLVTNKFCSGLNYCNLGVIGWTSANLLYALETNVKYQNSIRTANILTIDIGGNDILKSKNNINNLPYVFSAFKSNLYSILCNIRSLNNTAELYVMDIYNPYPQGHELYCVAEEWIKKFNNVIYDVCSIRSFKVYGIAPVYKAFKCKALDYTLIKFGNVHPNTVGHKVIAQCFEEATNICI